MLIRLVESAELFLQGLLILIQRTIPSYLYLANDIAPGSSNLSLSTALAALSRLLGHPHGLPLNAGS